MATGITSHPVAAGPEEDRVPPHREGPGPGLEPRGRATTVATATVFPPMATSQEVAVALVVGEKIIPQVPAHPAMVVQAEHHPSPGPASPMAAVAVVVVTTRASP